MTFPEKETSSEPLVRGEGLRLHFINPEIMRAWILNPLRPQGVTLAERIVGISEVPLGKFSLDGKLFNSANVTLIVEPETSSSSQEPRPTAIIRTDLQLGRMDSSLKTFQSVKAAHQSIIEKDNPLTRIVTKYSESPLQNQEVNFFQWSFNTARFSPYALEKKEYEKNPLVLLQIWEEAVGADSISISLLSWLKYTTEWSNRYNNRKIDTAETESWRFKQPVGIDVDDREGFVQALGFYQDAFTAIVRSIYAVEGLPTPNLQLEIRPPTIFKEEAVSFADIGGQQAAVTQLQALVNMEKAGFPLIRQPIVLLAGPPGNGKSSLVQAVAYELEASLVTKTTRDLAPGAQDSDFMRLLESGYLEAKAAAMSKKGKAVYCLEAIETMLGDQLRLHDRFLNLMDAWVSAPENDVLVIATSNFPERLHPGITSRFNKLDILPPDKTGIIEIFKIHAAKLRKLVGRHDIFGEINFEEISKKMAGFSGRDIAYFLSGAYSLRRQLSQGAGHWLPMDTEFLLSLLPSQRKLGFKT